MEDRVINIKKILASTCDVFGVEMSEVKSKSRMRALVDARKAIVYFLKKYFNMSSNNVSEEINKNHCIVNYMFRQAEILLDNDTEFQIKIERIKAIYNLDERFCPCCGRSYEKAASVRDSSGNPFRLEKIGADSPTFASKETPKYKSQKLLTPVS